MPVESHIDSAEGVVFSRLYGVVTDADVLQHVTSLARKLPPDSQYRSFLDVRDVTEAYVTNEALERAASLPLFHRHARRAIVADDDLSFGLARIYQALSPSRALRVCRTVEEARRWIGLEAESERPAAAPITRSCAIRMPSRTE